MGVGISRQWEDTAGRTLPLLAAQMLFRYTRAGASRPPVTAALIAANALVYLRPGAIDAHIPWLRHVLFNPHLIIKTAEISNGGRDPWRPMLFGMSVVRNARAGDVVWLAVVVPAKYVPLLELLLIHALNPEAHFVVNVGRILAGLTYLCPKRGSEPLALMFSDITHFVSQPVRFAKRHLRSAAHRRGSERLTLMVSDITDFVSQRVRFAKRLLRSAAHRLGSSVQCHVISAPREIGQGMWRCITCSYDNSRCADVCEMCSTPHPDRAFSSRKHLQDGGNSELSAEELRRRRLQRFER